MVYPLSSNGMPVVNIHMIPLFFFLSSGSGFTPTKLLPKLIMHPLKKPSTLLDIYLNLSENNKFHPKRESKLL